MTIKHGNTVYFVGIGGIGMSAIARFFVKQGADVHGYDRSCTPLTKQLEKEGMHIHYVEDVQLIPAKTDLVVYTPAIPSGSIELQFIRNAGFPLMKRAEVLGELTKALFTVAIAGTHGKTTITSMTAHLLYSAGLPISAFIGGISNNFGSNLVTTPDTEIMVVEADEYDKSFLRLHPSIAVISSMDADHLDIYGEHSHLIETFHAFAKNLKADGKLILHKGLPLPDVPEIITYGIDPEADVNASNIRVESGCFVFDLSLQGTLMQNLRLQQAGRHNIENALAAASVAMLAGVSPTDIVHGISSFTGVQRRFDFIVKNENVVYIDDYAHHPEELRACISGVRELYPGKRITGIFQPHLFSRTRDLMEGFTESLALLDELILLEIYPAREEPIPGVNSQALLDNISLKNKQLCAKSDLLSVVEHLHPEVLITLGAGDIDQFVKPLQKLLSAW